ncbi:hypothetical protein IMZ48_49560 [Candidatus Bathyarchaeota archaeon]|nr:hypothetical protein [Candidatus Bathyarchaeota archaeon]
MSTRDGRFGRDTVYEDYGSELVASWALDCTEVDGTPAQQSITVQIDSLDGVDYDDLVFTVAFHQANPVAILDIDGPLVDFPALDLTGGDGRDFWAQHHGLEGDAGGEVAAAVSEMQFLRIQQREFGERIRVLEAFIEEADAEMGVCRGRFRCLMRSVLNKVTGMASNAYETVMGPGKSHGNGTHAVPPSRKRPLWRPPFCPCAPSSSPTGPPPEPVPEDSPTVDDEAVPDEPDVADQSPHIEPPRPETPQTPDDDAEDQDRKTSTSANKVRSLPQSKSVHETP